MQLIKSLLVVSLLVAGLAANVCDDVVSGAHNRYMITSPTETFAGTCDHFRNGTFAVYDLQGTVTNRGTYMTKMVSTPQGTQCHLVEYSRNALGLLSSECTVFEPVQSGFFQACVSPECQTYCTDYSTWLVVNITNYTE
jgi:hypothetical protein